jgi:autotransporter adhesin
VSDTTSVPRASGSVIVSSVTPTYQTGSYTVNFNNTSLNGTLTGGSVELSGEGLSINALTGTASINSTTGVVTTGPITKTATTKVTADSISTGLVEADDVHSYSVDAHYVDTDQLTVYGSTYTRGIDNGGERITNVAPGVNGTDAVNLNQLNSVESRLRKQIDDTDKDAKKGIATVAAMANIPQVDESKTFSLGAGVGGYDSEWGFAVGGSYRVAPAVVLKGSLGTSDGGEVAGGLGISSSW